MNETVMQNPSFLADEKTAGAFLGLRGWGTEFSAYLLLTLLIVLGWLLRDLDLITPDNGVGYWLGIIGGTLMLLLLLYPLRKRMKLLHRLGTTRSWFQLHVVLGLLGPLLILYHSNFKLGAFNSNVALYSMLLVAGSGIVGRHIYAHIHRNLGGHQLTLAELQRELSVSLEKSHGLARLMPEFTARIQAMSTQLRGHEITRSIGIGRSLRWTFTHHFLRFSLLLTARRELRAAARTSAVVMADQKRLRRTVSRYVRDYTTLVGRVSQFSFYERLFALWHVFHLPIFFIMVLAALIHVLAVHMY
ncbi:MAG: pyridine nucleotide-disulfide oxidoreductase [Gammaproteobacteria bacterium]|nr:pyridine nucleotide-disulfide oxidoreductase [Gammaproteobacteria bacterium]MDH5303798.1 pyridine nucleotide-disulfide oxidoreductase [Gammaproteobacteria bacterium]MDH5323255.1 pyridine nucleotide-disulfide oxidoreductase [Gammaproteobacteria bacterium]